MTDLLQMRQALLVEAHAAAARLPTDRTTEWSINENAGTVIDVNTGELIAYLAPDVITPEWREFAARAFEAA